MNTLKTVTPQVIAVCGKGGVGKTSISATLVRLLMENPDRKVLAIDADPASGLAAVLGFDAKITVDAIRLKLIDRLEKGPFGNRAEIVASLNYELFEALEERNNLAFLAIGRPEQDGCFCKVNSLLKDIIESAADNFDYVVIDCEAGIEQTNRRVTQRVTHLLTVSDGSARGIRVADEIRGVAQKMVGYKKTGLILNRIRDAKEHESIEVPAALNCLGWLPEDEAMRACAIRDESIFEVKERGFLDSLTSCIEKLELPLAAA